MSKPTDPMTTTDDPTTPRRAMTKPTTQLIDSGISRHWTLNPGVDHGDLRIVIIEMRINSRPFPLDRMTRVTVRGPRIVREGAVTRGHFGKTVMLGELPEDLREQIIDSARKDA